MFSLVSTHLGLVPGAPMQFVSLQHQVTMRNRVVGNCSASSAKVSTAMYFFMTITSFGQLAAESVQFQS